ncbi:hypothetical protein NBT05_12345 [Aquimarina sp. ERC-38]|uniref:hypothetical protein n=1 Tax=Aquimarina sp. ERC-38 TaxID=2949996 RepID=UPI002246E10C|nr:hypothetical protein [Aquimarina sp. ERC-38]UZO79738.1 hypothetical protein NBT05_12345 [Aquimarina sp. ERC-38]
MKSKKDIELKHQYLRSLKKDFIEGRITRQEFYKYVLSELKNVEKEEDSFESYLKNIFKRGKH